MKDVIDMKKTGITNVLVTEEQNRWNLGLFIATHRKLRELTQKQLADKAGMDNTYLSRLEKGQIMRPKRMTLEKIAKAMNLDTDLLVKRAYAPKSKDGLIEDDTITFNDENRHLPPYLAEIAQRMHEEDEVNEAGGGRATDELIEDVLIHIVKDMLKEGDFVKSCRGLLEKKLKKELMAKAAK